MSERQRSLWAWGWRDKFPDETARKGLTQMVGALLPSAKPELRPLPSDAPTVGDPTVAIPDALADFATQRPYDRAARTRGRAFVDLLAGFAGEYAGAPDIVVRPRDATEVVRVLAECDARGWAVVPFGGGTSVVQGVDSTLARTGEAVVCLDLAALAGVHEAAASRGTRDRSSDRGRASPTSLPCTPRRTRACRRGAGAGRSDRRGRRCPTDRGHRRRCPPRRVPRARARSHACHRTARVILGRLR